MNSGIYQTAEKHPQFELKFQSTSLIRSVGKIVLKMKVLNCNDPALTFFVVDNTRMLMVEIHFQFLFFTDWNIKILCV